MNTSTHIYTHTPVLPAVSLTVPDIPWIAAISLVLSAFLTLSLSRVPYASPLQSLSRRAERERE